MGGSEREIRMSATSNRPAEYGTLDELLQDFRKYGSIQERAVTINDADGLREQVIDRLAFSAVFGEKDVLAAARWLIWETAQALGCRPASIHDYYLAGGRGAWSNQTTPATNLRAMTYDVSRAMFRVRRKLDIGQQIFEIARSEIGYTAQRPHEYTSSVLAAAIREGYTGPVFLQGDHFQINASNFKDDPEKEVRAVEDLAVEAINAGFYNIDVDSSTIVDLSLDGEQAQQRENANRTAAITAFIRRRQPEGITISVGGEIGEVGTENSTVPELRAFMDQYNEFMQGKGDGLSKISVQTGTSHGGVVLPDGSIAKVAVDFDTLGDLSKVAREEYKLSGAVQHGASTLPDTAFGLFSEANASEVHLATGFQNIIYDSDAFPDELRQKIYAWLDKERASERKDGETSAQFYYKTRKRAFGPFKRDVWMLDPGRIESICAELEERFELMLDLLGVDGTTKAVNDLTPMPEIHKDQPSALKELLGVGD